MFDDIENLKLSHVSQGISKPYFKVTDRKSNTISFRIKGEAIYDFGDRTITVNEGKIVFLPRGSSYEFRSFPENESQHLSISFHAEIADAHPEAFSFEAFTDAEYFFNHFFDLWKSGTSAEKHKCLSLFYSLLSYLCTVERASYSDKRRFHVIAPAVNYLKEHLFDTTLNVNALHVLCGISDTYFRKIFISNFGVPPQKYIIDKRISHAKAIIDNGDFSSIGEVALSVGYNDPLYFSRAFKKRFGVSPTKGKEI